MTVPEKDQNHYQVLGIERTADERAVKKAYFGLIRKFSPETHPEEFKRIREAYEVLSDPIARQRFDDAEKDYREYDDDVAAALKEAEAAEKAGDEAAAQTTLLALVEAHPDVRIARENLAASYSRTKSFKEALKQLDALLEAAPEEARYHLFRGLVLRDLERPKHARTALSRAHQLKPDDLAMHLALVDLLHHEEEYDNALEALDEAASLQKEGSPGALRVRFRRIHVLVTAGRQSAAEAEVTRLIEHVNASEDAEIRPYASSQLAAIAATCFARREVGVANALLRRAEEIHPDSLTHHPYPGEASVDVAALPQATQEWMTKLVAARGSLTRARTVWGLPALAVTGSVAGSMLVLGIIFAEPHPWSVADLLGAGLGVAAGVTALSLSARRVVKILGSPLRAFVTVHPLFLIEVAIDRAKIRSLLTLGDVRVVHHHVNGIYSRTEITLFFDMKAFAITIVGKEDAEGWASALIGFRNRALELMMAGYLEANEGADMIPPVLLTRPAAPDRAAPDPAAQARARRWYLGTAAATIMAWALVSVGHARAAEGQAFQDAVAKDTPAGYRAYLEAQPTGRHAGEARRLAVRAYEMAEAELRAATDPRAPGATALLEALAALKTKGETRVPLSIQLPGGVSGRSQAEDLATRLGSVLDRAGVSTVLRFVAEPVADAPVQLVVRIEAESRDRTAPLTCVASVEVAGAPPRALTWRTTVGEGDPQSLARWLSGALGLGDVERAVRFASPPAAGTSPYPARTASPAPSAKPPARPARKP